MSNKWATTDGRLEASSVKLFLHAVVRKHVADLQRPLNEADRSVSTARPRAVELYVENPQLSLSAIKKATGVDPKTVYRIISRCLEKHVDGRIDGFRAAIPYARLKQYGSSRTGYKGEGGFPGVHADVDVLRDWTCKVQVLEKTRH